MSVTNVKNPCLRVPLDKGEDTRRLLLEKGLLRTDLQIKHDERFLYLPLKDKTSKVEGYEAVYSYFKKTDRDKGLYYKDLVNVPADLRVNLPSSYDIIGDIILIKIPSILEPYKRSIGEALMEANRNIRVVYSIKPVQGELRLRDVEVIAGEDKTETTHREYGLAFRLDVKKTYYSPRLANERRRVASLVKPGETVVDMFTGVAPFPVMIARYSKPRIVYGLDKNPDAVRYAEYNIRVNKVLDKVELINMDSEKVEEEILAKRRVKADRVIMNLPFQAYRFFKAALRIINKQGVIHYYDIIKEEDLQGRLDYLNNIAREEEASIKTLMIKRIKSYSPREFYIGVDIQATKKE